MITKIRYLHFAKRQSDRFSALFRRDRAPLRIFEQGIRFEGSPLYEIYKAGCVELCFQLLGSSEVDETFRDRFGDGGQDHPAANASGHGRDGARGRAKPDSSSNHR